MIQDHYKVLLDCENEMARLTTERRLLKAKGNLPGVDQHRKRIDAEIQQAEFDRNMARYCYDRERLPGLANQAPAVRSYLKPYIDDVAHADAEIRRLAAEIAGLLDGDDYSKDQALQLQPGLSQAFSRHAEAVALLEAVSKDSRAKDLGRTLPAVAAIVDDDPYRALQDKVAGILAKKTRARLY